MEDLEVQQIKQIKKDQEKCEVPVWEKLNLKIEEASQYSNIGETTIRNMLKMKGCPFLLRIGNRQLVKRKEFEDYLKSKHYI